MRMKRFILLALVVVLTFAMCACQQTDNKDENQQTQQNGEATQLPAQGDSGEGNKVDFGLQTPPDPDFDSPDTSEGEKLYTIIGDYAYELDPATLQPIGPPLDPITHEPVENPVLDGQNPSSPNNPQYNQGNNPPDSGNQGNTQPDQGNSQPDTGNQGNSQPDTGNQGNSQPDNGNQNDKEEDKDTSLPNTGMFLEDD